MLHTFTDDDGALPVARLAFKDGDLYGMTEEGGADGVGVIFRLGKDGSYKVLHTFTEGADGGSPAGGLVMDRLGNFYGTTSGGGIRNENCGGCGVVFRLSATEKYKVLYSFTGGNDGLKPYSEPLLTKSGKIYGVTPGGGGGAACGFLDCGTVYEIDPDGTETVLHRFTGDDGKFPYGALVAGENRELYGTASQGGPNGVGVVFAVKR